MPDNPMLIYELRLLQLARANSWPEVEKLVNYFMTHEAERRQVPKFSLGYALLQLALYEDDRIRKKALWALLQLERWEEIGQAVRIWIDPEKEFADYISRQVARLAFGRMGRFDVVEPMARPW